MKQGRGKILVIRGGAIGDFILTLPSLTALRRQFPESHVEVLGYPHIARLALAGGLADGLKSIEARALARFFVPGGELDAKLADYFAGFALIVSYLYDLDGVFQANVARCSKAQFIAGPHRPEEKGNLHATDVFLKPLERVAIFDADPVPRLDLISPTDFVLPLGRWVALHPGSGSDKKNWPEQKWGELMTHLMSATALKLLLVGGDAEGERLQRLSVCLPAAGYQLAKNVPLAELAQRLKQCTAFVGHDSGISHLAAALGLRGLVLWGDTKEAVWRPRSERIIILRDPAGVSNISVESVVEHLSSLG